MYLAQGIQDTLTILASLRPRSKMAPNSMSPFVPSPKTLKALHRSLLGIPGTGWNGTLPLGRASTLRDDMTVRQHKSAATTATYRPSGSRRHQLQDDTSPSTPLTPGPQATNYYATPGLHTLASGNQTSYTSSILSTKAVANTARLNGLAAPVNSNFILKGGASTYTQQTNGSAYSKA